MYQPLAAAVAMAVLTLVCPASAEDQLPEQRFDPSGTWTWKRLNQSAVHTLKLELDEGRLTGTLQNHQQDRHWPLEEAVYKDGVVSFQHTYQGRDGQRMVAKYQGTLAGDTIRGTIEITHPDRPRTIDWAAQRAKTR